MSIDKREDLLKNFILLYNDYPNIPINILCEPLLKQIQIYLEAESNDGSIMLPSSENFRLNTTDFELFMCIANHGKCSINLAI